MHKNCSILLPVATRWQSKLAKSSTYSPSICYLCNYMHILKTSCCCFYYFNVCFCSLTGDGGNDVSMIQAADCGIGIEGKVKSFISEPVTTKLHYDLKCFPALGLVT